MDNDTPPLTPKQRLPVPLQIYQIAAQTILGVVGVGGYIALVAIVISHTGDWTPFQQNQIAGALGFLAGTIVAGVFGYVFGSSFSSMSKDARREREDKE